MIFSSQFIHDKNQLLFQSIILFYLFNQTIKDAESEKGKENCKGGNDNSNSELPNLELCKPSRLSRSRSGSPANFDIKPFEKEKSPFLQVKQLLKPVKKTAVSTEPEWKKVGKQLKPRIAPLALQPSSKVKYQVEKMYP